MFFLKIPVVALFLIVRWAVRQTPDGHSGEGRGWENTGAGRRANNYNDGAGGVLQHRGYPIEQLCERSTYLEVAYLLINGALPTSAQMEDWVHEITIHTFVHENVKNFMQGF